MSGVNQICREVSKEGKQEWMKRVKTEFQNGPLASNVVFGLILMVLERLVETEFVCPCKGIGANFGFVATFFIVPMILAFALMASVQDLCSCDKDNGNRIFHCFGPAFVWMILLVVDGRYIACAMTNRSGRYVTADKAAPLKWCEPENGTSDQNILKESQDWYFHSQWAGLGLVLVLAYLIKKYSTKKSPAQSQSNPPAQSQSNPPAQSQSSLEMTASMSATNSPDTNPTDK